MDAITRRQILTSGAVAGGVGMVAAKLGCAAVDPVRAPVPASAATATDGAARAGSFIMTRDGTEL
jgi:hypothetical protein